MQGECRVLKLHMLFWTDQLKKNISQFSPSTTERVL